MARAAELGAIDHGSDDTARRGRLGTRLLYVEVPGLGRSSARSS
jgi:hypothetical protein